MQTIWLSPTDYVTGDTSLKVSYSSIEHPDTIITSTTTGDFKWISIGLPLPANTKIEEVMVCYQVSNPRSFISQVRLTEMNVPNQALVIHDDGTDLQSVNPVCYNSNVGGKIANPGTAVTLALRLNFQDVSDRIMLGAIGVKFEAQSESSVVIPSYPKANLPTSGIAGSLARVTDDVRGAWMDQGNQWFELNGGVINAKEFGAIGDGQSHPISERYATLEAAQAVYPCVTALTDEIDWAAIQTAIQTAISPGYPYGGKVLIPPGIYIIKSTITVSQAYNIDIEGIGGMTRLRWCGTYNRNDLTSVLNLKSCCIATIRNLTIECHPPYHLAEGIRINTKPDYQLISTRVSMYNVSVSSISSQVETCVRIGDPVSDPSISPPNNDFHLFVNCSFSNYGHTAVAIENHQVYQILFLNCILQGYRPPTSATGAISVGSKLLTHGTLFDEKDVDKIVEVEGADLGGNTLRTRIKRIVSSTVCELHTKASVTVGPSAKIHYGPQCGITSAGSFTFLGGGAGNHLYTDFYIVGSNSGACTIRDAGFETSRQFLVTHGPMYGVQKKVLIDNVRFSGDGVQAHEPHAIDFRLAGQLLIQNSSIGEPQNQRFIKIKYDYGDGTYSELTQFLIINSIITSEYVTSDLFPAMQPNEIINSRHSNSRESVLLGTPVKNLGIVSGLIKLNWGFGRTILLTVNGDTTFSFHKVYVGLGTTMRLHLKHAGGPWSVTFSGAVLWPRDGDPGTSTTNGTDIFEFISDGTVIYGKVIGQGY